MVVPELAKEMSDWTENYEKFCNLAKLCEELDTQYADNDRISKSDFKTEIKQKLRRIAVSSNFNSINRSIHS